MAIIKKLNFHDISSMVKLDNSQGPTGEPGNNIWVGEEIDYRIKKLTGDTSEKILNSNTMYFLTENNWNIPGITVADAEMNNTLINKKSETVTELLGVKRMEWPRIRDLPEDHQEPFKKFLCGKTVPVVEDLPIMDQDVYYPWDYKLWCERRGIKDG